jgi:tetratricopeptide (TPR) repeat protein
MQYASVCLFVDRARLVDNGFQLHRGNAAAVARLCRALDGMPLALELAAARLAVESIDELMADERGLVVRLERQAPDSRMSSLARSLEWSLEKLDPADLALFQQLAVFSSPFTRDQVLGLAADPASAQETLDRLVRGAMVVRDPESARYRVLATSKEYLDRHSGAADLDERQRRHADLMLRRARDVSPIFRTSRQHYACEILRAEFADYRQAMHWFLSHDALDDATDLLLQLFQFGFNNAIAEVSDWATQLAALIPDDHPRAAEVCGASALAWWSRGQTEAAIEAGQRAVRCAEGNPGASTIWARMALVNALSYAGRMDEVGPNFAAHMDELRRSSEEYWNVLGLGYEGISMMMFGRSDRAQERIEKALSLARRSGNPECLHWALYCLGRLLEPTDPETAMVAFEEAMDAARSVESRLYLGFDLLEWVGVRRRLGDAPNAVVGLLELIDILHSSGNTAQRSQLYCEIARVLADAGEVSAAGVVFLARSGLPHMPKGQHLAEPETALNDRLRELAGAQWPVLQVRAAAMTDSALLTFARARLEALIEPPAAA